MKNEPNKPARNLKAGTGSTARKVPDEKTEIQKPQAETGEKWKHPDPTIPERKRNPDPTKPEKEEGPMAPGPKQKKSPSAPHSNAKPKRNPARSEIKSDESVGEFIERDIEQLGINGEEKEEEEDLEEEEEQMSRGIQRPQGQSNLFVEKDRKNDEGHWKKSA